MTDPRPSTDPGQADGRGQAGTAPAAADPIPWVGVPFDSDPEAGVVRPFTCPNCGGTSAMDGAADGGLLACRKCGAEYFVAADPTDADRELADRMEADRLRREQALNTVRVRQVLTERRSLFRTRSYFLVLAGLAGAAGVQLGIFAAQRLRSEGVGLRVIAYLAVVVVLFVAARACVGRIRFYNRELAKPVVDEPTVEPDFSTLSDGSQRLDEAAANLERLSGRG